MIIFRIKKNLDRIRSPFEKGSTTCEFNLKPFCFINEELNLLCQFIFGNRRGAIQYTHIIIVYTYINISQLKTKAKQGNYIKFLSISCLIGKLKTSAR